MRAVAVVIVVLGDDSLLRDGDWRRVVEIINRIEILYGGDAAANACVPVIIVGGRAVEIAQGALIEATVFVFIRRSKVRGQSDSDGAGGSKNEFHRFILRKAVSPPLSINFENF